MHWLFWDGSLFISHHRGARSEELVAKAAACGERSCGSIAGHFLVI